MTTLTIEVDIRRLPRMELEFLVEGLEIASMTATRAEIVSTLKDILRGTRVESEPHEFAGVDISFRISVGSDFRTFSSRGIAATDDSGRLTIQLDVDEDLLGNIVFFELDAYAFLPPTQQRVGVFGIFNSQNAVPGSPGDSVPVRILKTIQRNHGRQRIVFNAAGFERKGFFVAPMPEVDNPNTFSGVPDTVFEILDGNNQQVSVGILRGNDDPDNERSASLFVPENLNEENCWLRVREGLAPVVFRPDQFPPRVLLRSRIRSADGETRVPVAPAAMRIEERSGIGSIAAGIPEFAGVEGAPLVYRDLDLDLVDDSSGAFVFRVRCDAGFGWENDDGSIFVLHGIGKFQMFFRPGVGEITEQPFTENELETGLRLAAFGETFDMIPGTDLDELIGIGYNQVESALASAVRDRVVPIIRTRIAGRIRDRVDEERRNIIDAGNPLFSDNDWRDNVNAIFQTFFFQLESIATDVDGMDIVGRAGVWQNMVDLATGNVQCAINALGAQMLGFPIIAVGRTFEKKLSSKGLSPWREIYRKHSKEIAKILARDRKLSVASARLLVDAVNVAHGNQTGLSPAQIEQARGLISQIEKKASNDLKQSLDALDRVLVESGAKSDLWSALERAASVEPKKPKKTGSSKKK